MNLSTKQKQNQAASYQYLCVCVCVFGGGQRAGINWEIGNDTYTLLYIQQMTNKDLPCNTRNSTQCSVMIYVGK